MQRVRPGARRVDRHLHAARRPRAALQRQQHVDRLGHGRPGRRRPDENGGERQDDGGDGELDEHRAAQCGHVLGGALRLELIAQLRRASLVLRADGRPVRPPTAANACAVSLRRAPGRDRRTPSRCCTQTRETPAAASTTRTRTSLARSTQPYVVTNSAVGDSTSRTACTVPLTTSAATRREGHPREGGQRRGEVVRRCLGPQHHGQQAGEATEPDRHGGDVHDGDGHGQAGPRSRPPGDRWPPC